MPASLGIRLPNPAAKRRAFTYLEMLATILILGIVATIGFDAISDYSSASRPQNAARECLLAFRYARQLAISSGKSTKVTFNTGTGNFSVYWMSNGTSWDASPVAQPMAQGGTYSITMSNSPELRNVTLSLNPAATTTFTFDSLGNLDNTTVVTFTCAGKTATLTVSKVGDPQVN